MADVIVDRRVRPAGTGPRERRATTDRRAGDRRSYLPSNYDGPERRVAERRSGIDRRAVAGSRRG